MDVVEAFVEGLCWVFLAGGAAEARSEILSRSDEADNVIHVGFYVFGYLNFTLLRE